MVAMQDAARLVATGDLATAESVYTRLLERDADDMAVLLRRAQVRSWQGKFAEAEGDFNTLIANDPQSIAPYIGLGYTYAWQGRQPAAQALFRTALTIDPGNPDATRGMAFSALWNGDAVGASTWFRRAVMQKPDDPDLLVGLAQAEFEAENRAEALRAYRRALQVDPDREEARAAISHLTDLPPTAEATLWGGASFFGGDASGESNTGIRLAELALQPSHAVRLWLQIDNGLSMDNIVFTRQEQSVPAYYLGGFGNYAENYTSRFEAGFRRLDSAVTQVLLRGEQVFVLPTEQALKLGFWIGSRSDERNEWIAHAALRIPFMERLELEPAIFYARTGIPGEYQFRVLASGEYFFPQGLKLGLGLAGGAEVGNSDDFDGVNRIFDSYLRMQAPVAELTDALFLMRYQLVGESTSIISVSLGFTAGIAL